MGRLVGGTCYVSEQAAHDAIYSAVVPWSAVYSGSGWVHSVSVRVEHVPEGGAPKWQFVRVVRDEVADSATTYTTAAPALVLPECDPFDAFSDGMTVAWGIVAACVAVYAVKFLASVAKKGA